MKSALQMKSTSWMKLNPSFFRRKADFITTVISSIKDGFLPPNGRI